jgi:citrate synthase
MKGGFRSGLEGVIVAETVLSEVDGEHGRLIIRGYPVEEIAAKESFESVAGLLWKGFVPGDLSEESIRIALAEARLLAWERMLPLLDFARKLEAVEGLRLMLSGLSDSEHEIPAHVLVTGAMPVFVAGISRYQNGDSPLPPNRAHGQAEDLLYMLHGEQPSPDRVRALNTYLITVSDHALNASTFAARVIASTRAGMISSVIGGLCALKGPLHGGAPGPVLEMLDAIGTVENAEPWLTAALDRGERLMGFGHRIYRVRDPRADVLKMATLLLRAEQNRIQFAEQVERIAIRLLARRKPGRKLDTNVEFYTALLLDSLGFRRNLFTPVFACGRVAGWTAHAMEQASTDRLMRPASRYTGPLPSDALEVAGVSA